MESRYTLVRADAHESAVLAEAEGNHPPGATGADLHNTDGAPPQTDPHAEKRLGLGLFSTIVALMLCILLTYALLQYHYHVLPDCIAYVFLGLAVGGILRLAGDDYAAVSGALPNQEQFMLFVLPPVLFEAGYSLNKGDFFAQAGSIVTFAVMGTIVSALAFGFGLWFLGVLHLSYRIYLMEALAFGALISAVDPVATIAVFNALQVNSTLHYLVLGESVINDAVAIVLFQTFQRLAGAQASIPWWQPIQRFLFVFLGSTAVGSASALLSALLFKHTRLYRYPVLELSMLLLLAYLPYTLCEGLELSGVMAILATGILMAHYTHHNLSSVTKLTSQQSFKMISHIAETFIFVYLGLALTLFRHSWHIWMILWGIVLTLAARFVNVFPLSAILNRYRREKITATNQFVLWFSGLRGAVAFALSLNFPSGGGGDALHGSETRRAVISTTLAIVIFTVIVLGGGTMPILRLLRVEHADASAAYEISRVHAESVSSGDRGEDGDAAAGAETAAAEEQAFPMEFNEVPADANGGSRAAYFARRFSENLSWLQRMDQRYLQPWLRARRHQVGHQGLERFLKYGRARFLSPTELSQIVAASARDEPEWTPSKPTEPEAAAGRSSSTTAEVEPPERVGYVRVSLPLGVAQPSDAAMDAVVSVTEDGVADLSAHTRNAHVAAASEENAPREPEAL